MARNLWRSGHRGSLGRNLLSYAQKTLDLSMKNGRRSRMIAAKTFRFNEQFILFISVKFSFSNASKFSLPENESKQNQLQLRRIQAPEDIHNFYGCFPPL